MAFDLELTDEQEELRDWVHGFAADVVRPAAAEWDEREETPWPVIQEAAKIGLYGFDLLAELWSDPTGLSLPVLNEELFWGDAGIGMSLLGSTLAAAGIFASGTPDQIIDWIPRCFGDENEPRLGAFCVSEPDAGSDVASMRTRAQYDEAAGEWVISGQKAWITNGGIASVHVVVASVEPELGARGQAAFLVPSGTRGLSAGPKIRKLGLRASHTADVFLDEVRVPADHVLGGKDRLDERLAGYRKQVREGGTGKRHAAMATFELSRPTVGAQALGIARAAYEYALDYAGQRVQFGRPIVRNQAIAFALADMKMEIDCARLLIWRAAWMGRNGQPFTAGEASMAKLKAGEVAVATTGKAVQILGGAGFSRDHPVERWYRDSKIYTIFEGTSEIQRLVIARAITGQPIA